MPDGGPTSNQVIVGVHGLSRKPPEPQLTDDWLRSLREGLGRNDGLDVAPERLGLELVYWADWLKAQPYGPGEDNEPYMPAPGNGPCPGTGIAGSTRCSSRCWTASPIQSTGAARSSPLTAQAVRRSGRGRHPAPAEAAGRPGNLLSRPGQTRAAAGSAGAEADGPPRQAGHADRPLDGLDHRLRRAA